MNNWYNWTNMNLSNTLAEDVGAPELRSPKCSGMRSRGWLKRLFKGDR